MNNNLKIFKFISASLFFGLIGLNYSYSYSMDYDESNKKGAVIKFEQKTKSIINAVSHEDIYKKVGIKVDKIIDPSTFEDVEYLMMYDSLDSKNISKVSEIILSELLSEEKMKTPCSLQKMDPRVNKCNVIMGYLSNILLYLGSMTKDPLDRNDMNSDMWKNAKNNTIRGLISAKNLETYKK